jgi:hypothetical protein
LSKFRMRVLAAAGIAVILNVCGTPLAGGAADLTGLKAVRGTVGYQTAKDAPFQRVIANYPIKDNELAITQAASNGLLTLADSSQVALGASTSIQVGLITQAEAAAPRSITLIAGAVRFAVRHPQGAQANYTFQSALTQVAVRGTDGLFSSGPNGDTITCLNCAAGDVTVTAAGKSFPLLTGQTAFVSLAGVVTLAATAATVMSSFSSAGLSTVATSTSPFAAGVGATAAGGISAGTAAAAAAALAGAAAVATSHGGNSSATNASPAPTTQSGTTNLTSKYTAPAPPAAPPSNNKPPKS